MVGQEGGIDEIGIAAPVGRVRLLLGGGEGGDGFGVARAPEDGDNLARGIAEGEVEDAGDAAGVVIGDGGEALPDLRHEIHIGLDAPGGVHQEGQHLAVFGRASGVELLGGIQPEAGNALVQPELHDAADFPSQRFISQVQVGHSGPEFALVLPVGALHGIIAGIHRLLFKKVVVHIRAHGRVRLLSVFQGCQVFHSLAEPGMIHTGVVQHQIQNHPDIPLFALGQKKVKILHGAVLGVDIIVIHHIVFVIGAARVDGHEPDAVEAHVLNVIELRGQTLQVADAVTVAVAEGIDKHLVKGAVQIIVLRAYVTAGDQLRIHIHPRSIGGERIAEECGQKQCGKQQARQLYAPPHTLTP